MKRIAYLMLSLIAGVPGLVGQDRAPTAIDRAFNRMYNFDFPAANAVLDEEARVRPENPLIYSVRAVACLFSEFHRLKILETAFFVDDGRVTDRKKLKPDAATRARLFEITAEARKRALARLAADPQNADAILALCMAAGAETDYTSLVEKRYFRGYSLSKETQRYARRLLALNPPVNDAYLVLGSAEYVVGNLNFFFRLFVRFDKIQGSKQKAVEDIQKVIAGGRYYPPFAKIILSIIHLRENRPQQALVLLQELQRDFPENPLIRSELKRVSEKINSAPKPKS